MFQQLLRDVVERVDGCIGGILMGYDGIAVESYLRAGELPAASPGIDVESVGMEFGALLPSLRQAAQSLRLGGMQEVELRAEELTTVIRLLNQDYFVALTVQINGNAGKARFLLRLASDQMLSGLS